MSSMIGSRATARPSQVRMFLRADTAEELVGLQLRTNVFLKGRADYTDFQFVKGKWYCWFLVDIAEHQLFLEQLNVNTR